MPQGTIREYDPASMTGVLLMEDRSEIRIEPSSIAEDSGIRTLRLGQRVRFELEEGADGRVARALRIVTV